MEDISKKIKKPHKKRGSGKKNMKLYVATQNHYNSSKEKIQ